MSGSLEGERNKNIEKLKCNLLLLYEDKFDYLDHIQQLCGLLFSVAKPLFFRISDTVTTVPMAGTKIGLEIHSQQ